MIKNIKHTPLLISLLAIRTCWQSFDKSDTLYICPDCKKELLPSVNIPEQYYCNKCNKHLKTKDIFSFLGAKDKELIDRIGNKYKHLSTLEHISIGFETTNQDIIIFFKNNNFSYVKDNKIITNLRVLFENKENNFIKIVINYLKTTSLRYLFDKNDNFDTNKVKRSSTLQSSQSLSITEDDYVELLHHFKYGDFYNKYTFSIKNISRALLQELARHRSANLSVKSTRYTLKELKKENNLLTATNSDFLNRIAKKYIVLTNNNDINNLLIEQLKNLKRALDFNVSNDIAKYALPECYKTDLIWSISEKDLAHFLELRNSKDALWEIRRLSQKIKKLNLI